jgi:hypothetical protein
MKKTLESKLFENFVGLNKEATQSFKEVKTNLQDLKRPFSTITERKRRHFSQNKSPKV